MAKKATSYEAKDITVLDGLDGCRAKPAMYIGYIDDRGILHLGKEIIGNSLDEATNGYGSVIAISIEKDTITVFDTGRGIPVGKTKDNPKLDALTAVATKLHAGGKLDAKAGNYTTSIGCFVGSTKIKLLNGKSVRIDKLAKHFENSGKKQWVYAFNKESGLAFVPRKAYGAFATRLASMLTTVILDNGEAVTCTPDHPFMTWNGDYVEASKLRKGQSLRAVHFALDKDGYLTHSGAHRQTGKCKSYMNRVSRTVALGMGWDIEGKQVSHKNAVKINNIPSNLQVMENKEHWWYDHDNHGKNLDWVKKDKKAKRLARKTMKRLNDTVEDLQIQAQLGRYAQIAARAYRDYGIVNEDTYNSSIPWCGPKWEKAILALGSERNVLRAGKNYLRRYGEEGKTNNGGLGLSYKLQSEYEKSPVENVNNHKVVSVKTFTVKKPVQVYGMSVEQDHNYLLEAGVFVKNTHGVGLAVVNALSTKLQIWTHRNNKIYTQSFSKGKATSGVEVTSSAPKFNNKKWGQGTIIRYTPDLSCFEKGTKHNQKLLIDWIKDISWFVFSPKGNKRVPVTFLIDNNGKVSTIKAESLRDYVENRVASLKDKDAEIMEDTFMMDYTDSCDFVGAWTTSSELLMDSACNAVMTPDGGTHLKGATKAIFDAFQKIGKKNKFTANSLLTGFVGCFNIRVPSPQFDSQAKTRLTLLEAEKIAYDAVTTVVTKWIRKNKESALKIVERATEINATEIDAKLAKKLASALQTKKKGRSELPPKLVQATTKIPEERELFILEGDSAGGTAKKARNEFYQEALPLRGKILNVEKSSDSLHDSQAIIDILKAVGFNPKDTKAPLRVGKIFILSDPDPDGPLAGDTKVWTVDGAFHTISSIYEKLKQGEDIYVWSMSKSGKIHPSQVKMATKKEYESYLKITLDDGSVIKMTHNHRQPINYLDGMMYVRGKDLKVGDSIPVRYIDYRNSDGNLTRSKKDQYPIVMRHSEVPNILRARNQVNYTDNYGNPMVSDIPLHQLSAQYFYPKKFKKWLENKAGTDMFQIDHVDRNQQDNRKHNLQIIRMSEHAAKDGAITITSYNKSEAKRELNRTINSSNEHISSVRRTVILKYASSLIIEKIKVGKQGWNENLRYSGYRVPRWGKLTNKEKQMAISLSKPIYSVSRLNFDKTYEVSTFNRNQTWYDNTILQLKELELPINKEGLEQLRSLNSLSRKRTLSWEVFKRVRANKMNGNHVISKIQEIKKSRDMYCLSVPEAGNFFIADKDNNMVLTGNCHINALCLSVLWQTVPHLFEQGKVFVVNAPLYIYSTANDKIFGSSLQELSTKVTGKFDTTKVTRIKGYGECSPSDLRLIAFNPETRSLTRVDHPKQFAINVNQAMGTDTAYRKKLLGFQV